MRPTKLTESVISEKLGHLSGWNRSGESLNKTYTFTNFVQAMEFVNQVAETAEELQHHPDIDIRFNKVIIFLTTHDAGGITENDFNLARLADEFASAVETAIVY